MDDQHLHCNKLGGTTCEDGTGEVITVDQGRRWFGGLLALLGGSAALSACSPGSEAESLGQVGLAATGTASTASGAAIFWADTIAELRAVNGGDSNIGVAIVAGASNAGDGGAGVFRWSGGSATDDDGITIVPANQSPNAGYWIRLYSGPINVRWFTNKVSGGDWRPAILAAIAALHTTYGGTVHLPAGVYVLKSTVLISRSNIHIEGDGVGSTLISYQPTESGPAFHFFDNVGPTQRIAFCSLRRLRFGAETSSSGLAKTAVVLNNADRCIVEDVGVFTNWTDANYGSVGVRVIAGQINQVRRVTLVADVPISIDYPTATGATTNLDHLYLADLTLGVTSGSQTANIAIAEGVFVSNLVIDGQNSFNGGKYGIFWKGDLPASAEGNGYAHLEVHIRNIRMEGLVEDPNTSYPNQGHAIFIAMGYHETSSKRCNLQNLSIQGVRSNGGTSASDGLYLRGVQGRVQSSWLLGSDKGVDVDGNVECHQVELNASAEPQGGMFVSRVRDILLSTTIHSGYNYRVGTLRPVSGSKKYQRATVTVLVDNAAGTVNEGGTWLVSTAGITRLSGSARTDTSTTTDRVYMTRATNGEVFLWHSLSGIDEVRFTLILEYSN
jgi:hypothetical protein